MIVGAVKPSKVTITVGSATRDLDFEYPFFYYSLRLHLFFYIPRYLAESAKVVIRKPEAGITSAWRIELL